jgi:hypothetical protein
MALKMMKHNHDEIDTTTLSVEGPQPRTDNFFARLTHLLAELWPGNSAQSAGTMELHQAQQRSVEKLQTPRSRIDDEHSDDKRGYTNINAGQAELKQLPLKSSLTTGEDVAFPSGPSPTPHVRGSHRDTNRGR